MRFKTGSWAIPTLSYPETKPELEKGLEDGSLYTRPAGKGRLESWLKQPKNPGVMKSVPPRGSVWVPWTSL